MALLAATTAVLAGGLIGMPAAHANSLQSWLCGSDNPWSGYSNTTAGPETSDYGSTCGTVGVKAEYRTYPTSALYVTGWYYGSVDVVYNPHALNAGGVHHVHSCGWVYTCGPRYT